ncbi:MULTISPECIES: hypothetical protein [unclassified Halomonas]|uniref:hypothetical protein n=1 Tax=unclassified Halomonas TaxID=2609666 RepID=UPI00209FB202|nr:MULTISPECIES: hypothetical protein [unclassified Halomonas]MCP1315242.1 hypothetical protein [Halomonas sp. 707D7]MCP1327629.1 hypothetical protein [Halomonas sp. 707D4]
MSYQPTYEDAMYLMKNEWRVFDRDYAFDEIVAIARKRHGGEPVDEASVTERIYQAYLDAGAEPLTESPIPPGTVLAEDDVYRMMMDPSDIPAAYATSSTSHQDACDEGPDTDFGVPCVECEQSAGCCLKAGAVQDKEDSSRRVEWPPVDGATTLLVIAQPQEGVARGRLNADVEVTWEGESTCQSGRPQTPCISANGIENGSRLLTSQSEEISVTYDQSIRLAESLSHFIPFDVTLGFIAFEALFGRRLFSDQGGQATFGTIQCFGCSDTSATLTVIPYPCTELNGDVGIEVETIIMTSEVSAKVEVTGTLNGQYGRHKIEWSRSIEAAGGGRKEIPRQNDAPGLIGLMVETVQTITHYVSMGGGASGPVELDSGHIGSGITISKSLSFKPQGFVLQPVSGSPDLELQIGNLESALSLGVTGRIDLIEIIATIMLSPAGADRVQKARARIEAGERVSGTIQGYLELSATGTLQHTLTSGAAMRIPASGESEESDDNDVSGDFTGTLQILGRAEIKLHVEGSVFMVRAQAGVRGSIHTSWTWEARKNSEGKREKRYIFEGVKLSGEAYAEIGYKKQDDDELIGGRADGEADLLEGRENTEEMGDVEVQEEGEEEGGKTIWPREEGEWTSF